MRKLLPILLLTLLVSLGAGAQHKKKHKEKEVEKAIAAPAAPKVPRVYTGERSYIGISGGPSIPLGLYAAQIDNSNANGGIGTPNWPGSAGTGYSISAEGTGYLTRNFGLCFGIMYGYNKYSNSTLDQLVQLSAQSGGGAINYTVDPYHHLAFMGGVAIGFSQEIVSFEFQLKMGVLNTSFSNLHSTELYSNYSGSGTQTVTIKDDITAPTTSSFAFAAGMVMRFHVADNVSIFLKPQMLWCTHSMSLTITETQDPPVTASSTTLQIPFNMPVTLFTISAGVAYDF